jgi:hypothetical protein
MTAPVGEIGETVSLLTMLGGKVVYAAGPYAQWEEKQSKREISKVNPR